MKKQKLTGMLALLFVAQMSWGQLSFGVPEKINNDWKFILEDVKNGQETKLNVLNWQSVDLPHDWSVQQKLDPQNASCMGYLPGGIGWYRKNLHIPQSKQEEKVFLYFEGVYNRSKVYLNGFYLGTRPNGYMSFVLDATPYIKFGADNVLAVRVDRSRAADSRWYSGSGIYRDVWLVYSNQVHIAPWGIYAVPEIKNGIGKLKIEVEIENQSDKNENLIVQNTLFDPSGNIVSQNEEDISVKANRNGTLNTELTINTPQLWSLETPSLYQLQTTVKKEGKQIEQSQLRTGFRTFAFDPDKGFALNGKNMKIKGVCLHHDAGVLGAAFYPNVWKRRLKTLKEIGVNAIRTSHNPQSPEFYDLCDELGLLVLNEGYDEWEFPKRKWLKGWNVGTPGFEGTYDIFKEWGIKDMEDLACRDRNHVSVFAWSIGNEVDYPNDPYSHPILNGGAGGFTQPIFGGYKEDSPDAMRLGVIAQTLVNAVKKHDNSRPITAGLAGVAMSNQTGYPFALDIAGYNYTENKYDEDHKKYPERIIFGSENRHELGAWKPVRDKEFIFGQFLWTGIDYLGESGKWPSRGFYSGLIDFGGFIKPRGFFRQSLWAEKPMIFAGTYISPLKGGKNQMNDVWSQLDAENNKKHKEITPSMDAFPVWNYSKGDLIRVVCYTNAAKAKLLLNGKQQGDIQNKNDENGIIYWDIPYKPGKLEAIGVDNNHKEVSRTMVETSNAPYAMEVIYRDKTIKKGEVAQVAIQVVDKKGVPVMLSNDEITCRVIGGGKLLGLESSNNEDMTDYTDNTQQAYHGRMIAYIKATENSGTINIQFTSSNIKTNEVNLIIQPSQVK